MSNEIFENINRQWQKGLSESSEAMKKLLLRGITRTDKLASLELGLAKIPDTERMSEDAAKGVKAFGLSSGSFEGMASLPLRKKDGRLANFLFLSLDEPSGDASTSLGTSSIQSDAINTGDMILRRGGVVNLKAFSVFKKLVLVDRIDEYFAYFQHVKENVTVMLQSEYMSDDIASAALHHSTEEIILINNSPYWEIIKGKFKSSDVKLHQVDLPENKTIRQYLKETSANKFLAHIEAEKAKKIKRNHDGGGRFGSAEFMLSKAEALTERASRAESRESRGDQFEAEYLQVIEETGELRFASAPLGTSTGFDRLYRVRGFSKDGFEKIVQLSLEIDGRSFPDKIDLSRSQGRQRFANIAGAEFEISADIIRTDLAFIYKTLDKMQDERFKQKAGLGEKNIHIVTNDDAKKAMDLLTSRDILDEILMKDTERLGYVEEEINKKLFYLSASSRLTGKPLSVLDISPPGSGKSFGLSTIMDLMPPDELLKYSRITPNTLYYKSEEELKGKALYIEEIVGMEESLEAIRMLLSSGELAASSVGKDSRTGAMKSFETRVKADVPLVSSGVRDIFDEETLSRFVLTYNDVTRKHVERILKAQAYKYSLDGEKNFKTRERIIKRHRDIQKMMDKNIAVVNPFAEKIMLNPGLHIATRKQEQYLRLIHTIAFLRQHSREKKREVDRFGNEFTYIEVRHEDIETANEIASHVFRFASGDLTKRLHDAYRIIERFCMERIKEKRLGLFEFKFSRREIREYAGWDASAAKRLFDELEALEYIRKVRGEKQGMQFLYRLVMYHEKGEEGSLRLLDPEKL